MKLVIIGGDAAGMSAASKAKRNLPGIDVIVLEKSQDVSYSACGMPYNIADANRMMEELVVRPADVFRDKQGIGLLTGHTVESIDPVNRTVQGTNAENKSFQFPYDRLLIATGARPIVPQLPGIHSPGVMALKSLADGRNIKNFIAMNDVRKTVIIGMGYIGLEMAEALSVRGIEVEMIKPGPDLLPWMGRELADVVRQELESNHVRLHLGQTIAGIEAAGPELIVACGDRLLKCGMVLVAAGVRPNSELASRAGIATGESNAIAVDRRMRTSDHAVFAAGDCADTYHVVTGRKAWIPLALVANRGGWAAADSICGVDAEQPGVVGTAVFKVFALEVARTGISMNEALHSGFEPVEVSIQARSRAHGHPGATSLHVHMIGDRRSGRLLGVQLVGREGAAHRINAGAVALHHHVTVEDFFRTDMAYAPPFGPVWDPMLTAANQLLKRM
jgi:CoA-dependent NAD(P)H sulfur oxidoreductase